MNHYFVSLKPMSLCVNHIQMKKKIKQWSGKIYPISFLTVFHFIPPRGGPEVSKFTFSCRCAMMSPSPSSGPLSLPCFYEITGVAAGLWIHWNCCYGRKIGLSVLVDRLCFSAHLHISCSPCFTLASILGPQTISTSLSMASHYKGG